MLPIAHDGSANYVCIVLDGPSRGQIVFFDHEGGGVTPIAHDFNDLLNILV